MNEIWIDIKGFEGLYKISNKVNIKSLSREYSAGVNGHKVIRKEKMLKQFPNKKTGYMQVTLIDKNGKHYLKYVHRLMAEHFIPNPNNLPEVNHINENKQDNRVENLEYCDRKYNCNFGTGIERNRNKNINNPKTIISVKQYDLKDNLIKEWISIAEAVREGGFDGSSISQCINGKLKSHKNFIWKK